MLDGFFRELAIVSHMMETKEAILTAETAPPETLWRFGDAP